MKTKQILLLLTIPLLMSSCATIFCGSRKQVVLESNIKSANTITVDGTKYKNVSFPFPVKVRRGFN